MDADGESPGQCGTTGAAQMAEAAGVKKLILVHMGANISKHGPLEKGLGDIREVYNGQVIYAEELMSIEV
jgi:ribonuclease BN (tRNA processing enzyme)